MKKVLFSLVLLSSVGFLNAQTAVSPASMSDASQPTLTKPAPAMTFEQTEMNYGVIAQGSDPLRKFKFKNTGADTLRIMSAQGSCGCTVPTYKKEPIAPGETGEIEVRYDTQRLGPFTKVVTLVTNESTPNRVLTIKGDVVEAKFVNPTDATSVQNAPVNTPRQ